MNIQVQKKVARLAQGVCERLHLSPNTYSKIIFKAMVDRVIEVGASYVVDDEEKKMFVNPEHLKMTIDDKLAIEIGREMIRKGFCAVEVSEGEGHETHTIRIAVIK